MTGSAMCEQVVAGHDSSQADAVFSLDVDTVQAAMTGLFKNRSGKAAVVALDPEKIEHDLARLVLSLMEFLRRLLELQAIRRMEAGTLNEHEEEQIGLTLMRAHTRLLELAGEFGLEEKDLGLDLGPLGRLM